LIVPGTIVLQAPMGLRNYAPVLFHGEEVHQIHKRTSGGPREPNWFVPHRTAQNVAAHPDIFEVHTPDQQTLRIGVEICNDCGSMKTFLGDRQGAYPDIYMLTAAGMSLTDVLIWDSDSRRYAIHHEAVKGKREWMRKNFTTTSEQNEQLDWLAIHRNSPGLIIQSDGHMSRVMMKNGFNDYTFLMPLETTITQTSPQNMSRQMGAVHLFPPIKFNN
jgi:hypothetical protein